MSQNITQPSPQGAEISLSPHQLGSQLSKIGANGIFAALVVIYVWFGGMKFTAYEAQGLVPLVENSPPLAWMYDIFSVRGFSTFLGVVEITIGMLTAVGGFLSAGLFVITLSFMAPTPGVIKPGLGFPAITIAPGQFLLKDVGLLAAAIFVLGQSLTAIANTSR